MSIEGLELKLEVNEMLGELIIKEIKSCVDENLRVKSNLDNYKCLKKKGLAELFNVSTQTIEKWTEIGLPKIQIDSVIIYNVQEASIWLETFMEGGLK